jgi:hypothetical protein
LSKTAESVKAAALQQQIESRWFVRLLLASQVNSLEITGEREEALTQQTPTSELLAIISSGVAELEPILRAILEKAKLSISDALAAAYSHAELGEKDLRLGSVLVFCNGVSISGLDKSMSNQAIESPPFICIQIFGTLHAPSANDVAKDRQFLVVDDDGFCHLTAPTTFDRPPKNILGRLAHTGSVTDHTNSCVSARFCDSQTIRLALSAQTWAETSITSALRLGQHESGQLSRSLGEVGPVSVFKWFGTI